MRRRDLLKRIQRQRGKAHKSSGDVTGEDVPGKRKEGQVYKQRYGNNITPSIKT